MNQQLEAVAREFATWRNSRKKQTKTPQELINQALSLRSICSDNEIIKTLKIGREALNRWVNQADDCEHLEKFVEIPPSVLTETKSHSDPNQALHSTLNVALSSGSSLSLKGNTSALVDFVTQLTQRGAI